MKSKRWKRRNRHTRPEWVLAWQYAYEHTQCYGEWHFASTRGSQIVVVDEASETWIGIQQLNTSPQHLQTQPETET